MILDSVKYTLPNGREAVALVNLETFVAARPISGRSPSTGIPFIAAYFFSISSNSVFEQTTEQWQDLKGKLTALLVRGRNNLDGIPPLPDPVIVRPPARDPDNLFLDDGEIAAGLSATVSRTFSGGLAETISVRPGETVAYSASPTPVPGHELPDSLAEAIRGARIRATGISAAPGGGS